LLGEGKRDFQEYITVWCLGGFWGEMSVRGDLDEGSNGEK